MGTRKITRKVQWKRGVEFGATWEAYLNGHAVAEMSVCESTPTGYYGRYRGWISKKITGLSTSYHATDTLANAKLSVQRIVDQLPENHEFLSTFGTALKTRNEGL